MQNLYIKIEHKNEIKQIIYDLHSNNIEDMLSLLKKGKKDLLVQIVTEMQNEEHRSNVIGDCTQSLMQDNRWAQVVTLKSNCKC